MTIVSGIVIQQVLWWLVLFVVLPIGIKVDDAPPKGFATSAPKESKIGQKLLITTLISSLLWVVVYLIIVNEWINLRD